MPDLPDVLNPTPAHFEFGGHGLTVFEWRGKIHFIAQEVGAALDYAEDGSRLVNMFTRWTDELSGERAPVKVEGDDLAEVKARLPTDLVGSRIRHLVLLTEQGLYRVLMLAGGPVACHFRDWLDSEVLPTLRRTGTYTLPSRAAETDVARQLELSSRLIDALKKVADLEAMRLAVVLSFLQVCEAARALEGAVNMDDDDDNNEALIGSFLEKARPALDQLRKQLVHGGLTAPDVSGKMISAVLVDRDPWGGR